MGKNQDPGLLRHKGGGYYGRFSFGGKTKFAPLNRTLMEVVRIHFAAEKTKVERVRKAVRSNGQGIANIGYPNESCAYPI